MMNTEENDPLWRLLEKAEKAQNANMPRPVSPFFSRNVLREIRDTEQEKPSGVLTWLRGGRHLAWLTGTAAIAISVVVAAAGLGVFAKPGVTANGGASSTAAIQPKQEMQVAQQLAKNPDSEVIKNLDDLLASDDNSVWLDHSAN